MSKKLGANITCPACAHTFPTQLYRTIWAEYSENRALILNDEINAVICPRCKHKEKLEFPFLCTNVKQGFALWYEPYRDPQIDKDIADYRKHMGPNSFYAKAPRISDWNAFKKALLEMETKSPSETSAPTISPEMQKKMANFVAYIEQRNKQTQKITVTDFIKNKIRQVFIGPKEVLQTLDALESLKSSYSNDNLYNSIVVKEAFGYARQIIRRDKTDVIDSINNEKIDPAEIALTTLWNVSNNIVSSGTYHIYRGVLSEHGKAFLFVFKKTVGLLLEKGFIEKDEAESNLKAIQSNIKGAG